MKTLIHAVAVVTVLSFAVSCGANFDGASSSEDLAAKSFDPVGGYAAVKKLAGSFTSGVTAVSLTATRKASASASSTALSSFTWIWTVAGEDGIFVDVELAPSGAKVLEHERRAVFAGEAAFEPSKLSVNGTDVLAIAQAAQKSDQPSDLYLGASVSKSGAISPRWTVGYAKSELAIDGCSGDLTR